jgi:hypothetical protein
MAMPKVVFVQLDNIARIVCDCGKTKTIDLSQLKDRTTEASIKCTCGNTFDVIFDYRQRYRKKVNLYGHLTFQGNKQFDINITNISMSGVGFKFVESSQISKIYGSINIKAGDYANITFWLDDPHKSQLNRIIAIKRVTKKEIGAEFCDNAIDKKLGFYLMP